VSTDHHYCERTTSGFLAEPANAFSNGAFLIAALVALLLLRQVAAGRRPPEILNVLVMLMASIGVGSFIFHTVAGRTLVLDVVPILLFILTYYVVVARYFYGVPWRLAWLAVPGFLVLAMVVDACLGAFRVHGIALYVATLIVLVGLGTEMAVSHNLSLRGHGRQLIGTGLLFGVSLTFRQLDGPVCDSFPLGTHFAWHLVNAVVLCMASWLVFSRWRETSTAPPTASASHDLARAEGDHGSRE
jgi:hypothetical protein